MPENDKDHALKEISRLCAQYGGQTEDTLYRRFAEREKIESTGFGGGVAIPHAKLEGLKNPFVAVVRFAEPVDWDAIDGEGVQVAIALVMPTADKNNTHLKVLSSFSRSLADETFIDRMLKAKNPEEMYRCIMEQMGEN